MIWNYKNYIQAIAIGFNNSDNMVQIKDTDFEMLVELEKVLSQYGLTLDYLETAFEWVKGFLRVHLLILTFPQNIFEKEINESFDELIKFVTNIRKDLIKKLRGKVLFLNDSTAIIYPDRVIEVQAMVKEYRKEVQFLLSSSFDLEVVEVWIPKMFLLEKIDKTLALNDVVKELKEKLSQILKTRRDEYQKLFDTLRIKIALLRKYIETLGFT